MHWGWKQQHRNWLGNYFEWCKKGWPVRKGRRKPVEVRSRSHPRLQHRIGEYAWKKALSDTSPDTKWCSLLLPITWISQAFPTISDHKEQVDLAGIFFSRARWHTKDPSLGRKLYYSFVHLVQRISIVFRIYSYCTAHHRKWSGVVTNEIMLECFRPTCLLKSAC